ncbi:MAG: hypothetical protein JNL25_08720 [Rhodospirillaceae bacterium]|nr:hypothetical protein [Rhodospirillaceae bacterium]
MIGDAVNLTVPPAQLVAKLPRSAVDREPARFVFAGDWAAAAQTRPHEQAVQSMRDLLDHGADIENSEVHRRLSAQLAAGRPWAKAGTLFDSAEKIRAYCEDCIATGRSIERLGYRSDLPNDAIEVIVTADGSLVHLRRGNHRVAFARLFAVPLVPVEVRHVHRDFVMSCLRRHRQSWLTSLRAGLRQLGERRSS